MKFSIYLRSRAWAFQLASALSKKEKLDYLVTGYPKFFTKKYGILNKNVKSIILIEIISRLSHKVSKFLEFFKINLYNQVIVDWTTDYIYSFLPIKKDNFLLLGFGNSFCRTIKRAKKNKIKTIYFLNTCEFSFNDKTIKEEYSNLNILESKNKIDTKYRDRMSETLKIVDHIVAISSFQKKTFTDIGIDDSKILVNPIGVDTKIFYPKKNNSGKFIVLCVANKFVLKGIKYLIDSFNNLNLKDSELWIVGQNTKKDAEKYVNLKDNNFFIGAVNEFELPDFYNKSSIFCLPTLTDSGPMVIPQAMACGLPVVSTKSCIAPDLITDGEDGFIIERRDTRAVSEKIKFLYENPDARALMGMRARKKIEDKFSWDLVAEKIINFYADKSDFV